MESRKAVGIFFSLLIFFFISHLQFYKAYGINTRQNLEIIIGGGASPPDSYAFPPEYGDCPDCSPPPLPCPPPPPPPCPPPPPPPQPQPQLPPPPQPQRPPPLVPLELQIAIKVIKRFRRTITSDPMNITKTWKGNNICKDRSVYKGFICDTKITDNKLRVALVNFNGYNFDGKPLALKQFLDGLTDLIVFHSNTNGFAGDVPFGISKISSLFELDLSNNKLSGEFPKAVLSATNLTFLDLRFNKLTGPLPPEVFTLDLDVLFLNDNGFVGNIPQNLGKTPSVYLTLANNFFTGSIPKSIGQSSNTLLEVLLLNNSLSGCLPFEIGLLKKATVFDASVNRLTGPIPHSFGCLQNMQYLNISCNQLYGTVPESLCKLGSLVQLTLNFNYITQVGPECRKLIAKNKLDVSMNCILDLPSQRSKEECKAFFHKQVSCPDPESMKKVPCKIDYSAANRKLIMAQPRSYAALQKHRT